MATFTEPRVCCENIHPVAHCLGEKNKKSVLFLFNPTVLLLAHKRGEVSGTGFVVKAGFELLMRFRTQLLSCKLPTILARFGCNIFSDFPNIVTKLHHVFSMFEASAMSNIYM